MYTTKNVNNSYYLVYIPKVIRYEGKSEISVRCVFFTIINTPYDPLLWNSDRETVTCRTTL